MRCNLVKVIGFDNKKVPIVPAYQLLLKNFIEGNQNVIDGIDLGYEFGFDMSKNGLKTPVWRVKLKDGTSIFFDKQGEKK